jgi:DNA polymerase-1
MFNTDDVYSAMAKDFFREKMSPEDLKLPGSEFKKKHRSLRDLVKTCTLGIIYGLTPHGLALRLGIIQSEAAGLQERFMVMFPALRKALAETPVYGGMCGHVSTVSGLRRQRARKGLVTNWERNWMVNHPVQGSAADLFKAAGNRLDRLYQRHDAWLIVPVHDAFVFEAPREALGQVAELTERVMVETVQEFFPDLQPKAEVNILQPSCWNKDARADSLELWMADPTFTF